MNIRQKLFDETGAFTGSGIVSFCIANELAIKSVLIFGKKNDVNILIESTSNQVNQFGGYTGMTPAEYKRMVLEIAQEINFKPEKIFFGGDHLGPLPFADKNTSEAMKLAEKMVEDYVLAGFQKIHLDTSMYLGDDSRSVSLSNEIIAERGVRLIKVAEKAYRKLLITRPYAEHPVYIIGSEVPPAGGQDASVHEINITKKEDIKETISAYKQQLAIEGLEHAWKHVIGLVIQPGVEYGNNNVLQFNESKVKGIADSLEDETIVFEGHSTDYQNRDSLLSLVKNRVAILKVGPAITSAMTDALFSLEQIEKLFVPSDYQSNFSSTLIEEMKNDDTNWKRYYKGSNVEIEIALKYSLLDRSRYYYKKPLVLKSLKILLRNINMLKVPGGVIKQFFPAQFYRLNWREAFATDLIYDYISMQIEDYYYATSQHLN